MATGDPVSNDVGSIVLSLVIPLYNEEERLAETGREFLAWLTSRRLNSDAPFELLFVDDGSTDKTATVMSELVAEASGDLRVREIHRQHAGKGATLRAGIEAAQGRVIAFSDVDIATPLDDLARLVDRAEEGGLVIGSRAVSGAHLVVREGRRREQLGRLYNQLIQWQLAPGIFDSQCGAKAALRSTWRSLLGHSSEPGWAWDVEVVAIAVAKGIPVIELPVTWSHDPRSKIHVVSDGTEMILAVPRIRRHVRALPRSVEVLLVDESASAMRHAPSAPDTSVFDSRQAETLKSHDTLHWWFRSKADWVSRSISRLGLDEHGLLVDVGAGAGGVTRRIRWAGPKIIVEPSDELQFSDSEVEVTQASADDLPLETGSAEVVCLLDVIEHLDEPVKALEEARRVLTDTGCVVVTVPAHTWLWSEADVALGHRRRYHMSLLRSQLTAAGFQEIWLHHIYPWLVPPTYLVRKRGSGSADEKMGLDTSDQPLVTKLAHVLTSAERSMPDRLRPPMGTSILAVARKAV